MKPSPIFITAVDAHFAIEKALDKLRNVRRPLTRSELYAINLVLDRADELYERVERRGINTSAKAHA